MFRGFPTATPLPALISERLGPLYERVAFELAPKNFYFEHANQAPPGFPGLRKNAPFPSGAGVVLRGFAFGFDHVEPKPSVLDAERPGCGASLVARDGSMCPSVLYPGVSLSEAQARELMAILQAKNPTQKVVPNGYGWRFGVLALDQRGVPLAQVLVDADVIKLFSIPGSGEVDYLSDARRTRLRTLLAELGLFQPLDAELAALDRRQQELDGELHDARFLPSDSGLAVDLRLRELDARQRAILCAWREQVFRRGPIHAQGGIECNDHTAFVGLDYAQCQSEFPQCDARVSEIESCLRRQRFDVCSERPASASCRTLRGCLPGIRATPAPG